IVVKASSGKIHLTGKVQIVVNIGIDATATLEIVSGKELHVKLLTLDALGGAAKNLVEGQLAQINPILNANDFPFDVQFTRVEIENGQVLLFGQVLKV
ncbi:MAG: LmeA family phospholipid-binding protein, partial [Armatimonadetes bacterium]|nr:LmeA family phospholipid-binding protein [Armatimonadota bacterium]